MYKPDSSFIKYISMAFQMLLIIFIFTGTGKYTASYIGITEKTAMAIGAFTGTCVSIVYIIRQLKT
ncbi:MAG: hypothetical protein ACK46W_05370 [Bacteroidota bacterium]